MGKFDVEFPDDLFSGLLNSDFDEIAQTAVAEAEPILNESMKRSCKAAVSGQSTGELVASIKSRMPKKSKNGAWIGFIGPSGYSKNHYVDNRMSSRPERPVSNALKALWLDMGRKGQPARPFLVKASNDARDAVYAKMQEVYEKKVKA